MSGGEQRAIRASASMAGQQPSNVVVFTARRNRFTLVLKRCRQHSGSAALPSRAPDYRSGMISSLRLQSSYELSGR